jgi:hypothetical protein
MTIQITTTSSRDRDALLYLLTVDQWQRRVTLKDGRRCYGIPSRTRPGLLHLTDGSACSCEDWTTRQPEGGCAHMRATVLHRMQKAAEQAKAAKPAKRAYAALFGPDDDKPWCQQCGRHHDEGAHYPAARVA